MTRKGLPIRKPPGTNIGYSESFHEMRVARFWGQTPAQWYKEPRWSRASMIATYDSEGTIAYWQVEDREK